MNTQTQTQNQDIMFAAKDYVKFLGHILLGLYISLFITSCFVRLSNENNYFFLAMVIFSVYANKRRINLVKKYSRYSKMIVLSLILIISAIAITTINSMAFYSMMHQSMSYYSMTHSMARPSTPLAVDIIYMGIAFLWGRFFYNEHKRGISFFTSLKILTIMLLSIIFCLFAFTSILNVHHLSGDEIFAGLEQNDLTTATTTTHPVMTEIVAPQGGAISDNYANIPNDTGGIVSSVDMQVPIPVQHLKMENPVVSDNIIHSEPMQTPNVVDTSNEVNIADNTGFVQASMHQTGNNDYVVQDSMGQHIGDVHTNDITGTTSATVDGTSSSINSQGGIHDGMGMQVGYATTNPVTGDITLHDNMGQTTGVIKADGKILDAQNMSVGKVDK